MFTDKSIKEFLDDLAAKKSTPGGGGAAALVGSLAAALTSMVANFTVDKKGYEENWQDISTTLEQAEELRFKLTELIDLDAKVFDELMAVYKMPKDTDEEKTKRTQALMEKAKSAALVPMHIARYAVNIQRLALTTLKKGNRDLESDAILSGILGRAALRSASYNVLINLKIVKDEVYNKTVKQELQDLLRQGEELEKEIILLSENNFSL